MLGGFYKELEDLRLNGSPEADFGFLENVPVGESYNLYDFLHGHCDEFAASLSDYYGYLIEYVLDNNENLIHAYCVTEINGEKAYIDARGITTDAELFFDEFADWCTYDNGNLYDYKGECRVLSHKDTREMYSDENREFNQDKDLVGFFQDNSSYYDVRLIERDEDMAKIVKEEFFNGDKNKPIYREWDNGYWEKAEYNKNGLEIYHENSDGFWERREYNERGDVTHYMSRLGADDRYEYDKDGQVTYFKRSDGTEWGVSQKLSFEKEVLDTFLERGFDVSEVNLEVVSYIDDKHKDVIWYGGPVAYVDYKGYTFSLEAHGDVNVTWFAKEGFDDDEYSYYNKNNSGAYHDSDALEYFVDDTHFKELDADGRLAWQNNNWFEMFVESPVGVRECIDVCSFNNIDECIVEMVEMMDEVLLKFEKMSDVDKLLENATVKSEETLSSNGKEMNKEEFELE